jgi:hypothetical protein
VILIKNVPFFLFSSTLSNTFGFSCHHFRFIAISPCLGYDEPHESHGASSKKAILNQGSQEGQRTFEGAIAILKRANRFYDTGTLIPLVEASRNILLCRFWRENIRLPVNENEKKSSNEIFSFKECRGR